MIHVGDRAQKVGGSYQATGEIRVLFCTRAGQRRAVFEFDSPPGLLHIFTLEQLKPMTETAAPYAGFKPAFVDCTAGDNAFTDCVVSAAPDGKVRILGHAEMLFNRKEVNQLIAALIAARDAA